MKKQKQSFMKRVSLFLAVTIVANLITFTPITAYAANTNFLYPGFTVNYAITNSWADNANIQITITNTGTESIRNWALQYDPCGTVIDLWGGAIFNENIIKNAFYNADIAPGANVSFGYTLMGITGTPDNFTLASYRMPKPNGFTAVLSVINNWGTGFTGVITLTNTTSSPIMAWELNFDTNFTITHTENFSIIENANGHYKITGAYNGNIAAGSSVTLQFNADSILNPEMSNVSLTEMVVLSAPAEYIPWLPEGLDKLVAFGSYDQLADSFILEWAYQDNTGDFEIYKGENLITTVNGERTYKFSADTDTDEYIFTVRRHILDDSDSDIILVSNEVIMRLNECGAYEFVFTDADDDGLFDLLELIIGTDPNNPDTDGDGLPDGYEVNVLGTDPLKADTNDNNISDANEDFDEDGLTNLQEYQYGTNPFNPDGDGDGLSDYDEIFIYETDPNNPDNDEDGINDGDEIKLGLDPKDPETFGYPDTQYTAVQVISSDNPVLAGVNEDNEVFQLSVEIEASGWAENNLTAGESGYSHVIQNDMTLGVIPELAYPDYLTVNEITLKFEIESDYLENELGEYADDPEFYGIKRLNVFKYFEDIDMLLPIETQFNTENNTVYTEVDEPGTYCLMDMEKWFAFLNEHAEGEETDTDEDTDSDSFAELTSQNTLLLSENQNLNIPPLADIPDISGLPSDAELSVAVPGGSIQDSYIFDDAVSRSRIKSSKQGISPENEIMALSGNELDDNTAPIEVVFSLQTDGYNDVGSFNAFKNAIVSASGTLFGTYPNIRIYVINHHSGTANYLQSSANNDYFTNAGDLATSVNSLSFTYINAYTPRDSIYARVRSTTFRPDARRFLYIFMSFYSYVYYSDIRDIINRGFIYSEFGPSSWRLNYTDNTTAVHDLAVGSGGLFMAINSSSGIDIYNHICGFVSTEPTLTFGAILATGWKKIEFDHAPRPGASYDKDADGLTDWQEIATESPLLEYDSDGITKLPTIRECIDFASSLKGYPTYIVNGLERYETSITNGSYYYEGQGRLQYTLSSNKILPILSDPTNVDGDGDGLEDGRPQYDTNHKIIAPNDNNPLKYNGQKGLWLNHIQHERTNNIPTNYANSEQNRAFENLKNLSLATKTQAFLCNFIFDDFGGAYHSKLFTWQYMGGYNSFYDKAFRIGSLGLMQKEWLDFTYNSTQYRIWMWRGVYSALGLGAEIGLYERNESSLNSAIHTWDAANTFLPMTLHLYNYYGENDIDNIFSWEPIYDQWWITGFNPLFQPIDPKFMTLVGSVKFTDDAMFNAFSEQYQNADLNKLQEYVILDTNEKTVWFTWWGTN